MSGHILFLLVGVQKLMYFLPKKCSEATKVQWPGGVEHLPQGNGEQFEERSDARVAVGDNSAACVTLCLALHHDAAVGQRLARGLP